jgi:subtilisin family serine protease
MPTSSPDQPSFLLGSPPSASPSLIAPPAKRGFKTGQKILAYPRGTMAGAVQALSNRMPLKAANIASVNDFARGKLSIASVFKQSDAQALRFEELDTVIVKDASSLMGLSPASVGSGPMPTVGDVHYVYPISQGILSGGGAASPDAMRELIESIQHMIESFQSASAGQSTEPSRVAVAATAPGGGQRTWGLAAINAISSQFTGKNVKVAIIDSGIDPNHPDLASRIAGTTTLVDETVNDVMGHGTHVAGTVAGARSGALAYGVAPEVQLFIAKVFALDGTGGTDVEIIAAINWAIQNRCMVANMSLSSNVILDPGTHFDPAFEVIAQNALKSNLLLVAAAGNLGDTNSAGQRTGVRNEPPAPVGHPANCPSVLAVGALAQNLQIAVYSNGGQSDPSNGQINFSAPGDQVVSSWPTTLAVPSGQEVPGFSSGFALDSGTSMACPHVAGLAALLSEKLGGTGGLQLWQALAVAPFNPLTGLSRRDVGFGMPLAVQS